MTVAGPASGNVTLSGAPRVYGDLTLAATGVVASALQAFLWSSTSQTITTNNVSVGNTTFGSLSTPGAYTLATAFTTAGTMLFVRGSLNTAGFNVTAGTLSSALSGTSNFSLALGASTVTIASNFNILNSLFSLTPGTSTINLTGSTSTFGSLASVPALTFNNVNFTNTNRDSGSRIFLVKANTFNNLSFGTLTSTNNGGAVPITLGANQTITGTLTVATASPRRRYRLASDVAGTSRTISAGAVSLSNVDFSDITAAGAASWTGTSIGNALGNSGITFTTAKTVYYAPVGSGYWTDPIWAATSGGTPSHANYPLPQDTAVIDNATGAFVLFAWSGSFNDLYTVTNLDASSRTDPFAYLELGLHIQGNLSFGPGIEATSGFGNNLYTFSGRSTQTLNTPTSIANIRISGVGNTVNLAQNTFCTYLYPVSGTLALNGYELTTNWVRREDEITAAASINFGSTNINAQVLSFSSLAGMSYTGTGKFVCDTTAWGGSTIEIQTNGTGFSATTAPPVTISGTGGSSDWLFYGGSGVKDLLITTDVVPTSMWTDIIVAGNLTLTSFGFSFGGVSMVSSGTITVTDATVTYLNVNASGTYTTSGTLTAVSGITVDNGTLTLGADATTIYFNVSNGTFNLSSHTLTTDQFLASGALVFGTGAKIDLPNANPSVALDGSGFSVTGTFYVDMGNTTTGDQKTISLFNFSDSPLAPAIVPFGSSGIVVPEATEAVVTIVDSSTVGHIYLPGFVGTLSLGTGIDTAVIYGDFVISDTTVLQMPTFGVYFSSNSSRTISTNFNLLDPNYTAIFEGSGTYTLQSNLYIGNISTGSGYSGTFAAGTYNVVIVGTSGLVFNSGTVNLGSGTWTMGIGTGWDVAPAATVIPGTSTISMTTPMSGASVYFNGGGKTYYNLALSSVGLVPFYVTGSNTFNSIANLTQPLRVGFETGATQTVTNFNLQGLAGSLVTLEGDGSGSQFTLSKSSGTVTAQYLNIKDSNAIGGARWEAFPADGNVNGGNNSGWIFGLSSGNMLLMFH
jgi:hypothetical protein